MNTQLGFRTMCWSQYCVYAVSSSTRKWVWGPKSAVLQAGAPACERVRD